MNKIFQGLQARAAVKQTVEKSGNEFTKFVRNQFKQLAKRNLRVPIQLYHL